MALQVYQQGAIGVPTTNGPIVHPQDGRCRREWIWKLVDELDRLAGNAYGTGRGLPTSWPAGLCSQRLTQGGPTCHRRAIAPRSHSRGLGAANRAGASPLDTRADSHPRWHSPQHAWPPHGGVRQI
jgi:hypothetical protein